MLGTFNSSFNNNLIITIINKTIINLIEIIFRNSILDLLIGQFFKCVSLINNYFVLHDFLIPKILRNRIDGKSTTMHAFSGGDGEDLNNAWLLDLRASHHLTFDGHQVHNSTAYFGQEGALTINV